MRIFIIDDDKAALAAACEAIRGSVDDAEIMSFLSNEEAILALKPEKKLEVKCFGHFDVYYNGKPLIFKRKQSKELLTYLIDRNGAACGSEEIALALWQDEEVDGSTEKNRIRVLINDLRTTLRSIGMDEVLIRENREIAVKKELIDCDYYRLLSGNEEELDSYYGEYMIQYPWAELTNGRLDFMSMDMPEDRNTSVLYPTVASRY
ncbi:MAG: winged helix-turn-helix domain-containing protein [Lachnospiraceae bacterium]|nr:winged helix-turn-helix domain-containing protein [Lachnospiraceae bacterium]